MPLKLKKGESIEECSATERCKYMAYVLKENAHETLTEVSSINMRTGADEGMRVILRMKGGGVGPLRFCPWCSGTLVKLKKIVAVPPPAKSKESKAARQ